MKRVMKILCSKWFILLVLIAGAYCYAGAYEGVSSTPVDELGELMTAVTADEAFESAYRGKDLGMSLEQYRASLQNIQVLKSRFLQGPLAILTSLLAFSVSVLLIQGAARLQERAGRRPQKTRLLETVDGTFPFLLAEGLKYFALAAFAWQTGALLESSLLPAILSSGFGGAVPYALNILWRGRAGRPVGGVAAMGAAFGAMNLVFQLL